MLNPHELGNSWGFFIVILSIIKNLFVRTRELLDALFLRELANQQGSVFLCHDISIKTLYNYFLFLQGMNYIVLGFYHLDIVSNAGITIQVFVGLYEQTTPCT